jgi:predicted metal-dependent phosphoesterase TrpH
MRVVLHVHSIWSYDGRWPLARIARVYGALGVDAVMMTEHDTGFDPARFPEYRAACAAASTRRCRLIPGIEYSSPDNDIHILTWGLDHFLAEHRPVSETVSAVSEAGGAAIFAHPVRRRAWAAFDPAWVSHLHGIELWNRKSDGIAWGAEAQRLIGETGLAATVGQDFHRLRHLYPLTMTLPLPAGDLEAGLVAALRAGGMRPQAFRRAMLDAGGAIRPGAHGWLERRRRGLRDLLRGKPQKKL